MFERFVGISSCVAVMLGFACSNGEGNVAGTFGPPLGGTTGASSASETMETGATMDTAATADAETGQPDPSGSTTAPVDTDDPTVGQTTGSAECGDGQVEGNEACDDAGESAMCNDDCTVAACGDGVVNTTAGETCDDMGRSGTCNDNCTAASCGDGYANVTAGEMCDGDGAGTPGPTASCDADCTVAECGDATVNVLAGETCDDGAESATCDSDCTAPMCGDAVMNAAAGEDCDDGGESATCDADCTAAICGDGTVNTAAGENCEGGGMADSPCPDCFLPACIPDPVAAALAACTPYWTTCVEVNGGVVGYDPPESQGSNCGPPTDAWRFYCTVTGDSNYNCSPCTVGEILGPHEPCGCTPGSSPVLGSFCTG